MFDGLTTDELVVLVVAGVVLLAVGAAAGMAVGGGGDAGPDADGGDTGTASEEQIRETADGYVQQSIAQQRLQLEAAANRSENLSTDDVSIEATITDVEPSRYGSLYRVNFTVQGEVPSRMGGGTQPIEQSGAVYVSSDGRYLFQQPVDLEAQQRSAAPTAPAGP